MDEPMFAGWALWLWRWRWDRHFAWLNAQAVRAEERSHREPWGAEGWGCACRQPGRRPGQLLAVHLRDLARVEEEMRHILHAH